MSDTKLRILERRRKESGYEEDRAAWQIERCRLGEHDGSVEGGTDGCHGCFSAFLRDQTQKRFDAPRTRFA